MNLDLVPRSLPLAHQHPGRPQRAGALTVLPLFGPDHGARFTPPLSGLKLAGVHGYGTVKLSNPAAEGITIVPLHVGYIQDQAQNHCLCGSLLLGAGQQRQIDDACCVQQAQGGYLRDRDQWFFILPLALREQALQLRGTKHFGKLWDAIAQVNTRFGLEQRGHLEQLICRHRPTLTQFQSRFELLEGQTGALFFLGERLVGVELAPNAAFFAEVWMPLITFCYGTAAWESERAAPKLAAPPVRPLAGRSLGELRTQLQRRREQSLAQLHQWLATPTPETFETVEQERYLDVRLQTVRSGQFVGQYVEAGGQVVYASLTAREQRLREALTYRPARN